MNRAVLGLGSNMCNREIALIDALAAISSLCGTAVLKTSYVYETKPVSDIAQSDYLNAVVMIQTALSAHALLGACLGIEAAMGRVRGQADGPRSIDIDVLVYEGVRCTGSELTLPHPRMTQRAFVLVPLFDLFPDGLCLDFDVTVQKSSLNHLTKQQHVHRYGTKTLADMLKIRFSQ